MFFFFFKENQANKHDSNIAICVDSALRQAFSFLNFPLSPNGCECSTGNVENQLFFPPGASPACQGKKNKKIKQICRVALCKWGRGGIDVCKILWECRGVECESNMLVLGDFAALCCREAAAEPRAAARVQAHSKSKRLGFSHHNVTLIQ